MEKRKNEKVFVRMSEAEYLNVKTNADKYTKGNISKWMRDRASQPMLDVSIAMQNEKDGELFDAKTNDGPSPKLKHGSR